MPFWPFRRQETLNQRLMREAGLDGASESIAADADPAQLEEAWFGDRSLVPFERLSGEVTMPRPRRWDVVVSAEAEEIAGDEVAFAALPDGSLIVDEEQGDAELAPLADAVEQQLAPPYRAQGVRKGDGVWAVAARKINVLSFESEGDEIELSTRGDERMLVIDGERAFGTLPELERLADGDAVIRAARLDGNLWEVRVDPL